MKQINEAIKEKFGVAPKDYLLEMFISFDNSGNTGAPAPIVPVEQPCTMQNPEGCQGTCTEVGCDEFGSLCNDIMLAIDNDKLQPYATSDDIDDLISSILASKNYTDETCELANGEKRQVLLDLIMQHLSTRPNAFMYGFADNNPVAQTPIFITQ